MTTGTARGVSCLGLSDRLTAWPMRPRHPGGPVLTAFTRAFKTPDLRRKLLFTLAIVILFRLGSHVPVPGVSYTAVQACIKHATTHAGVVGLDNLFSGG